MSHRPDLFASTLATMDYGVTAEEISDGLAELVQAVRDTGKQGFITLKMTVKPESINAGQVSITPDITVKAPQIPRDKSLMFMTPDNNLVREDPRQKRLDLESVPASQRPELMTMATSKPTIAQA